MPGSGVALVYSGIISGVDGIASSTVRWTTTGPLSLDVYGCNALYDFQEESEPRPSSDSRTQILSAFQTMVALWAGAIALSVPLHAADASPAVMIAASASRVSSLNVAFAPVVLNVSVAATTMTVPPTTVAPPATTTVPPTVPTAVAPPVATTAVPKSEPPKPSTHQTKVQQPAPRVSSVAPSSSVGAEESYADLQSLRYGWGSDQMSCLVQLWDIESGWNPRAQNGSGAAGIPQNISGFSSAYPEDNPDAQIDWGLRYISGRYGSPCNALNHESQDGWY
jgi:hypothetical protein